jgi:hypothetical protein
LQRSDLLFFFELAKKEKKQKKKATPLVFRPQTQPPVFGRKIGRYVFSDPQAGTPAKTYRPHKKCNIFGLTPHPAAENPRGSGNGIQ